MAGTFGQVEATFGHAGGTFGNVVVAPPEPTYGARGEAVVRSAGGASVVRAAGGTRS